MNTWWWHPISSSCLKQNSRAWRFLRPVRAGIDHFVLTMQPGRAIMNKQQEQSSDLRAGSYRIPDNLRAYIQPETVITRSPGRINLIGEHTDYNNGFVLPAAIDKAAYVAMTPRADQEIHLYSVDMEERYHCTTDNINASADMSWPNYILGVVQQFLLAGIAVGGFDAALTGDIPIGAGLSSSAAVECAVAFALNKLYVANLDKLSIVKLAQRAENQFVGVQCGIMDQFASVFGKYNHVIKLDCRSLAYEYEPFNMDGIKVLLLDTNVKHSLGSTEYNVRRIQCETGVALVQQRYGNVASLRDVGLAMLDECVKPADELVYRRCRYVIEENNRLLNACRDLEAGNLRAFGKRMYQSHEGLSTMYEVSCPELDFLVDYVRDKPAVLGARMMGGGFGGCTINLVEEGAVDALIAGAAAAYTTAKGKTLKAYVARIESGTCLL